MLGSNPETLVAALLQAWHDGVAHPAETQARVLQDLLRGYAQTGYGAEHRAAQLSTIEDYRRSFPIATYEDYQPLIQRVMAGEASLMLNEEPIGWAITRGTTKGESKFIPMTATDLQMRVSAGRAMMNYVAATKGFDLFMHTDAPPGSGLGSSSTMVVALVSLFKEYFKRPLTSYEIAEMAYKNAVQNLMVGIKRMKREREAMLDLSPTNALSLMVANDFDSEKFVERDVQLGIDIRNAEIKFEIMQKRYAHLFTEGA
jgi:hypothetical protein